jgi:hypothetical protein
MFPSGSTEKYALVVTDRPNGRMLNPVSSIDDARVTAEAAGVAMETDGGPLGDALDVESAGGGDDVAAHPASNAEMAMPTMDWPARP